MLPILRQVLLVSSRFLRCTFHWRRVRRGSFCYYALHTNPAVTANPSLERTHGSVVDVRLTPRLRGSVRAPLSSGVGRHKQNHDGC